MLSANLLEEDVENEQIGDSMKYTSRGLRRRGDSNKWQVTLSHKDPLTGESVPSYHTIEAKTEKQAQRKRDELILDLERNGAAYSSRKTLKEFLDQFIQYKEDGKLIERSTINHYRKQAKVICRYIGSYRLAEVTIPVVSAWMAQMTKEGYAPRSVSKPFGLRSAAVRLIVQSGDSRSV